METVISIIAVVGMVVLGAVAVYYRANAKLQAKVAELIDKAQGMYTDATEPGGERFDWVVGQLYGSLPAWAKPMLTREAVGKIVQSVFDFMKSFAKKKADEKLNSAPVFFEE